MGKSGHSPNESSGEYFFKKVTAPVHGTKRSITCDNWFTTVPLLRETVKDPYQMLLTGTIRKNKPDIPNEMKIPSKDVPASKFCHSGDVTLVSHTPKKHKIVLLVSTKITNTVIGKKNKPEVILHYNQTKGGTDVFDKLCHAYTTARATKRWPMRFFFGILDQAQVNARILYACKYTGMNETSKKISAQDAIKQLVLHLVTPYLRNKLKNRSLRSEIRKGIQLILDDKSTAPECDRPTLGKRARCAHCPREKDKKTKILCRSCCRPICDDHRAYVCNDCV